MLKAGMSKRDITPPLGIGLTGYPHYPRPNTGAHDPLWAACMYVSDGNCEAALVTLDILYYSKKHVAEIRRRVEEECGIPGRNIMISCSHTHSAPLCYTPFTMDDLEGGDSGQPREYVQFTIKAITEAIVEAKANAFLAKFGADVAMCGAESGVGGNRRIPGGPHDPLVSVMAVKDMDDKIRGVYVNYSLHPTFIHEWSTLCTADYPYYTRLEIEENEGNPVVCFAQGASGNQSSRYYRNGESYDEAERVGRAIGKAARLALSKMDWKSELSIDVVSEDIPFEIRDFGTIEELEEKCARDTAVYEELYAKYGNSTNRDEYYLWQNANLKHLGSENQLAFVKFISKGGKVPAFEEEAPAEIQIIRIGDACIVGAQGEIFIEYALYIKAMAGFKTVVFNELANGILAGYLYTPESLVTGGYETDTSMMAASFGKSMVDKALELIEKVK